MTEVTRSDLSDLERRITEQVSGLIGKAIDGLGARETTAATSGEVKDSVADELRRRGLSMKDLDALQEAKLQEKIDAGVDAALKRRDDEAEAERKRLEAEGNGDGGEGDEGKRKGIGIWGNAK